MAAPAKPRPARYLGVVALALVALYLGVFLGPSQTPALGLDLRGGTEVTLQAHPDTVGGKVTKSALNQAKDIISNRVNGLGVSGATVNTEGKDNIVVAVPGGNHDSVLATVGQAAVLRFRQVMAFIPGTATPSNTATPSASPSSSPAAGHKAGKKAAGKAKSGKSKSGKGSAKKSKTAATPAPSATVSPSTASSNSSSGDALRSVLLKSSAKRSPAATPSPTVSPSATTSPAASAAVTPSPSAAASSSTAGSTAGAGAAVVPLPNSEAPTLTTAFENSFANWDCSKHPNPTNGVDDPSDYIISCDSGYSTKPSTGEVKYLLAPAAVEGKQVTGASTGLDNTGQWEVDLSFNGSGSSAWQKVTAKAYNVNNGVQESVGSCQPPTGCNGVAITLDGQVASAPYISAAGGISGGKAEISGSFTQKTANDLANILKYGSLPLKFTTPSVESVSATLGAAQLRGGLIAGIIGLGLVIVFSLLYYRALGLVTVGSLAVSGLLLYAVTTLLGHSSLGLTLSLPGIAGFIVAVGITADSFVVFFERLRDEIREGRRLRSGVERAWPRARRTILSADTVSLLAAVILYIVSIGDVRGFAFTLGLSTLSDLFIVFFFTKPLLTILAKSKAFDSGKAWTGVGKARAGVVREALPEPPMKRSNRTREA